MENNLKTENNDEALDIEYYNRFPLCLKNALLSGRVKFPSDIQKEYEDLVAYRGVKYSNNKTNIEKSDFFSNMERNALNPMVPADADAISSYSCSCFLDIDEMRIHAKFPRKNAAIAKGIIRKDFGPIDINTDTLHVNLYLFDGIDPSNEFEVIEKWEKNG